MIKIFELTKDQQIELDKKIEELGDIHPFHDQGKLMGVILRFHEDIHIELLMGENQTCR